jgi:hypothetical protein
MTTAAGVVDARDSLPAPRRVGLRQAGPTSDCRVRGNVLEPDRSIGPVLLSELDQNGTIKGNVLVNNPTGLDENDNWTIDGTIVGNSAAELTIAATTRNILANNDDTLALQSATVKGNIVSYNGVFGACYGSNPPPYTDLGPGLDNAVNGRSLGRCATPNAPSPSAAANARPAIKAAGVPAP